MAASRKNSQPPKPPRWYRGARIPMSVIRRFARDVARQFDPDRIILFGSYAYGRPHRDSDVDVLVVMPARNQLDQSVRIELQCDPPFPLDLLVRTPDKWQAMTSGESLLSEIAAKGKVLYEKENKGVDRKGRGGLSRRRNGRQPG